MKSTLIALLLLVGFGAQAQYNLSFEKPTLDGNKFRVTLRMNATNKTFALGSNNLRFNYPVAGLANPRVVSEVFPTSFYHETTLIGSNPTAGIVSVNTVYVGKAKANKMPVSKKGMDLVEMEFDVLDASLISKLSWRIDGKQPKTAVLSDDRVNTLDVVTADNTIGTVKNVKFTPAVKSVEVSKLMISNVMPNPAKDDVSVVFDAAQKGNVELIMTDVLGRVIKSQTVDANKGINTVMLNLGALSYGTYMVKITDGISESVEKIVKQ
jgi:Secretion system C-terminal sorting domain